MTTWRGAEAHVSTATLGEHRVVRKVRTQKSYRHPELDATLRRRRIRAEARLLAAARHAGVRTPYVLGCHEANGELVLEHVPGPTLADMEPRDAPWRELGRQLGRLHGAGIVHGDPTPRNAVLHAGDVVLIDFGLAELSAELEDQGVDLVLVQRALEALDPGGAETWFRKFLDGYGHGRTDAAPVVERANAIRGRARYV